MVQQIEKVKYLGILALPKFEKSLDRLINKYSFLITDYHLQTVDELLKLIEKASEEGDSILIQPEYLGYYVLIWKSGQRLVANKY